MGEIRFGFPLVVLEFGDHSPKGENVEISKPGDGQPCSGVESD